MYQKKKYLKEMYRELMEMCHKPDVELLQDFGDIMARSESVLLRMPQPVNPAFTAGPITALVHRLNRFRGECRPLAGTNISPMLPHYVEKPLGRVGVFLDFESGSRSGSYKTSDLTSPLDLPRIRVKGQLTTETKKELNILLEFFFKTRYQLDNHYEHNMAKPLRKIRRILE
ncbi:hypothetical protein P7K49_029275 [Saguinus oedipus]|uniref:Uncharacterized protein n=1 Tax=Saguinus oedipus TaxID=9490 RepID=A0ABQ9U6R1_SAGOE|nr:hypothetical protein P7K49_029275 [Saguinus oedipus]